MKNKFCSNKANKNKCSWNTQFECTKDLYAKATEYESKFLSLNYEVVRSDKNEYAITVAKNFLDKKTLYIFRFLLKSM